MKVSPYSESASRASQHRSQLSAASVSRRIWWGSNEYSASTLLNQAFVAGLKCFGDFSIILVLKIGVYPNPGTLPEKIFPRRFSPFARQLFRPPWGASRSQGIGVPHLPDRPSVRISPIQMLGWASLNREPEQISCSP